MYFKDIVRQQSFCIKQYAQATSLNKLN